MLPQCRQLLEEPGVLGGTRLLAEGSHILGPAVDLLAAAVAAPIRADLPMVVEEFNVIVIGQMLRTPIFPVGILLDSVVVESGHFYDLIQTFLFHFVEMFDILLVSPFQHLSAICLSDWTPLW